MHEKMYYNDDFFNDKIQYVWSLLTIWYAKIALFFDVGTQSIINKYMFSMHKNILKKIVKKMVHTEYFCHFLAHF